MDYIGFCSELKKAVKRIFGSDLAAALIFGSYARLVSKKNSDIDLLIIVKKRVDRDLISLKKLASNYLSASIDIIILTSNEFKNMASKGDALLVGAYSAYDPLIGRVWLKNEFKKLSSVIKKNKISLMIGGLLWDRESLTS